ncbi:MAG: hypothetical protein O2971_03905 [Proteobacteria bacterium]|nr:hypothetical protein [Pseudomonadota bacterium]
MHTYSVSRCRWPMLILSIVLLAVGGEITVGSGVTVSESMGISATVVGLFLVAVGTSMPQLVTSIIAAMRNESDLAMGNII